MRCTESSFKEITKGGYERSRKSKLFAWVANTSIMDDFVQRLNARASGSTDGWERANRKFRKSLKQMLASNEKLMTAMHITSVNQLTWSRTAGCSCGCSPGFIINNGRNSIKDFHLTVEIEAE